MFRPRYERWCVLAVDLDYTLGLCSDKADVSENNIHSIP